MTQQEINTEQKILYVAREAFLKKGLQGARMQEIADIANINKSMLHYYFRTKEQLFAKVVGSVTKEFFTPIIEMMNSNKDMFEKIDMMVESYCNFLLSNPYIPVFIMSEMNRNPELIKTIFNESIGINVNGLRKSFLKNFGLDLDNPEHQNHIRVINQYMISFMSTIIFPIAAKPIISMAFFGENNAEYHQFMLDRKEHLKKIFFVIVKDINDN